VSFTEARPPELFWLPGVPVSGVSYSGFPESRSPELKESRSPELGGRSSGVITPLLQIHKNPAEAGFLKLFFSD